VLAVATVVVGASLRLGSRSGTSAMKIA
jgi:hypothetical protein